MLVAEMNVAVGEIVELAAEYAEASAKPVVAKAEGFCALPVVTAWAAEADKRLLRCGRNRKRSGSNLDAGSQGQAVATRHRAGSGWFRHARDLLSRIPIWCVKRLCEKPIGEPDGARLV